MLYLGGDSAVGMLPEGPVTKTGVIKGKGIGFKYLGYASIKYDQPQAVGHSQAGEKGPDARRRPKTAGEAYSCTLSLRPRAPTKQMGPYRRQH